MDVASYCQPPSTTLWNWQLDREEVNPRVIRMQWVWDEREFPPLPLGNGNEGSQSFSLNLLGVPIELFTRAAISFGFLAGHLLKKRACECTCTSGKQGRWVLVRERLEGGSVKLGTLSLMAKMGDFCGLSGCHLEWGWGCSTPIPRVSPPHSGCRGLWSIRPTARAEGLEKVGWISNFLITGAPRTHPTSPQREARIWKPTSQRASTAQARQGRSSPRRESHHGRGPLAWYLPRCLSPLPAQHPGTEILRGGTRWRCLWASPPVRQRVSSRYA